MEYAGIYIHVPFCLQKCPYCNFYSIPATTEALDAYTTAVCRNLRGYAENIRVDTIYLGGGTPSLLSPAQVEQILETAADCFLVTADAEITLEANPASCTPAAWKSFRKIGINRLSVGVQSLNDAELKQLGRLHTAAQAVSTIKAAADAGFQNLSGDLMLAIPEQTTETLAQTLHQLTALPLTHISAYLLKIEPTTRFAAQHIEARCPSDDDAAALYLQTVSALEQAGFLQYEISNFAKPGMKSRHNCKYWTCQPYLGIGPASHACWNGTRFWVPSSVPAFLTRTMQEERLEDPAPCQPSERLMLGMRLTDGVPISWLPPEKTAFLTRCIQAGLLESYQDHIRFTPKGFLVSNTILAELLP